MGLLNEFQEECHSAMLPDNMDISRLMVYANRVVVERARRRSNDSKGARYFY